MDRRTRARLEARGRIIEAPGELACPLALDAGFRSAAAAERAGWDAALRQPHRHGPTFRAAATG